MDVGIPGTVHGNLGRGEDHLLASVPGRGLVCVHVCAEGGLGGVVCGGVLLWRKASAAPGLFSEKVMGQASSRALPIVASLRQLVPET